MTVLVTDMRAASSRLLWTVALAAVALACAPAQAQTPESKAPRTLAMPTTTTTRSQPGQRPPAATPAQRAAYDKAFQTALDKPSDPETLARFAELAVQIGDIEGAISALERLLIVDSRQPEVRLELGVLYFRLGSKEAALTYLEAARAAPEATPRVRERAEAFLKAARR
jgi:Flp pilus assembly protein TadD